MSMQLSKGYGFELRKILKDRKLATKLNYGKKIYIRLSSKTGHLRRKKIYIKMANYSKLREFSLKNPSKVMSLPLTCWIVQATFSFVCGP